MCMYMLSISLSNTHPVQAMLDLLSASVGTLCLCCLFSPGMIYLLGTGITGLVPSPVPAPNFAVPLSILPVPSQRCNAKPAGVSPSPGSRLPLAGSGGRATLWLWLGEGDARKPRCGERVRVLGLLMEWWKISSAENKNPEKIMHFVAIKVVLFLFPFSVGLFCFLLQLFTASGPVFAPFFSFSSCGFEGSWLFNNSN